MYYAEIYLRRNNEKSTYKLSTSYLTLDSTFGFKKPSDIWHLEHFM